MSRNVTLLVNGQPLASINTGKAVAADYLNFLQAVTKALMCTESLEREANATGKTLKHTNRETFGAIPITDSKDLL
ncbi:MAG: hypothetical protein ACK5NJ_07940 [Citrobacter portucalensis]